MRLLFLGDVVGRTGRNAVTERLPKLIERYRLDFVIVNGENAAGGFGITEAIYLELIDAGADVVTTGNHAFDQKEALVFIERQDRMLRPLNMPVGTPGKGVGLFKARNGADVLVMNPIGQVFMGEYDGPFVQVERELAACPLKHGCDVIVIDFHAEATSEKQALGHMVDGRATLVVGTHTHTPTADDRVLPKGTAFMSDAGMCGDYTSVLGMDPAEPINRFLTRLQRGRFEPAVGEATLSGIAVETDDSTGLARHAAAIRIGGALSQQLPSFWEPSPAPRS
jgi:2',3'-cyclic-nucleotide 2'-phosphodiesterase